MHPQGVVLDLFGSVRPERREGQRSKGGMEEGRKGGGMEDEGGWKEEGGKERSETHYFFTVLGNI